MKKKHLSYMLATGLLLASCTNDVSYDYEANSSYNTEPVDVTFTITAENLGLSTRAYDADGNYSPAGPGAHQQVGKGSKIDMLIYAVYLDESKTYTVPVIGENGEPTMDEDGEPVTEDYTEHTYTLLNQYGSDEVVAATGCTIPADFDNCPALKDSHHKGHTVMYIGTDNGNALTDDNQAGITLNMRLMRNQEYILVVWAQSSQTAAYNTDNFRQLVVDYTDGNGGNPKNNDELRDAFVKAERFSVGSQQLNTSRTIYLSRPFAQINVGTTGADYKYIMENGEPSGNSTYTQSTMTLKGVAKYMDVLLDKILTQTDIDEYLAITDPEDNSKSPYSFKKGDTATTDVTFEWNTFPAYIFTNYMAGDFPTGFDFLGKDTTSPFSEEFLLINFDDHNTNKTDTNGSTNKNRHDSDGNALGYLKYATEFPTWNETKKLPSTETFKYMSMCYVMVPAVINHSVADDKPLYYQTVLEEISFNFRDGDENQSQLQTLVNIPVQRNWRTNILGGIGEKWEDSNSIFSLYNMAAYLDNMYEDDKPILEYK